MSDALAVSTDQSDYAPESAATFTATGVTPGTAVQFTVQALDPGADGVYFTSDDVVDEGTTSLLGTTTWEVVDGGDGDIDGEVNGQVITTWYVDPDALNESLRLTATSAGLDGASGTADDEVAVANFTDAAGTTNKVYQHWADGNASTGTAAEWNNNILSANKSDYFEGEVIPHVFVFKASNQTPLVNGQTYSFTVTYNYYQANTDAGGFAYMTTYNVSRQPGPNDVTNPYIAPTVDSSFTNGGGMQGNFYTVDANITGVSGVTYTGSGTLDGKVTVTFVYSGTTTTSGVAEIYYGLYIAQPGQVDVGSGITNGANAWSGGSLQTTVQIGNSGATSIQLAPAAIIPGEISGVKFNDLDGDGVRDADEPGLAGWTIVLDDDASSGNGTLKTVVTANGTTDDLDGNGVVDPVGFYYFSVTPDADKTDVTNDPYYVREVQQSGWTQTTADPAPITISALDPSELNVNFGNLQLAPAIHLEKSGQFAGDTTDGLNAGDQIQYTFTVTNAGNVPLTNVSVAELSFELNGTIGTPQYVSGDTGNDGILEGNEAWIYSATYTLSQQDVDDIFADMQSEPYSLDVIDNEARATGYHGGTQVTDDDTAQVPMAEAAPALLTIDKAFVSVTGGDGDALADAVGDVLNYTVTVTNTGNVTLTGVTVTDPLTGQNVTGVSLAPGASASYDTTYTLTQADLDKGGNAGSDGDIDNTATADSDQTDSVSDSAEVPLVYAPAIAIDKSFVNVTGGDGDALADAVGDVINYKVTVTNTGNVTLTGVTVNDPLLGGALAGAGTIAVGGSADYYGSYTITQADLNRGGNAGSDGDIDNTATADSNETGSVNDSVEVPLVYNPAITIDKSLTNLDDALVFTAGTVIEYTIVVDNTGNVDLTNVVLDDVFAGGATLVGGDTNGNSILETTETWTYSADYTVTQADLLAGTDLVNVAGVDTAQTTRITDDATSGVFLPPVIIVGNPQFNFPNDLEKIQPKLQGGGADQFTINPDGYIYWDLFTPNAALAHIDVSSGISGYAGLTVSIVEIWNSTGTLGSTASGAQAIYRVYLVNESDTAVSMNNSTDAVNYDIVAASKDKGIIDLVNSDPLIGNFNSFSNIENAISKVTNGFVTTIVNNTYTGDANDNKVWTSGSVAGTATGESAVTVDGGGGDDAIYGRNNTAATNDVLSGGTGNDMLEARDGGDTVNGGDGNDVVFGSLGQDALNGGNGNDILFGSYSFDVLTGGTGADIFVVRQSDLDQIMDFNQAQGDKIHLWTGSDIVLADLAYEGGFLLVNGDPVAQLAGAPTLNLATDVVITTSPWGGSAGTLAATASLATTGLQDRAMATDDAYVAPDIGIVADIRHLPADQLLSA